jgi:hypothetical protein
MEADKQEVKRSSLADREAWKQEGERFRVVDIEAGEQEVTRSRLTNGEILRQGGEGSVWLTRGGRRMKGQKVKSGKQGSRKLGSERFFMEETEAGRKKDDPGIEA